ncbi:hypothetical protein GRX01_05140 [Halobaculum sp. WSA2]|uniref:Uncharacterized protein n=1 Tax=Halobaculum saliterrae TaxID=2073113 RepID=A0A6B0SQH3_9EURY|nr:hypothetical protein [Halobaculum saliterrae]MXR40727.1 hypothetical protein [Halobaculum saliterrae]
MNFPPDFDAEETFKQICDTTPDKPGKTVECENAPARMPSNGTVSL